MTHPNNPGQANIGTGSADRRLVEVLLRCACFGAIGPVFYGHLTGNGADTSKLFVGYLIGAGVMILGGVVELVLGIPAERRPLKAVTSRGWRGRARGWPTTRRHCPPRAEVVELVRRASGLGITGSTPPTAPAPCWPARGADLGPHRSRSTWKGRGGETAGPAGTSRDTWDMAVQSEYEELDSGSPFSNP